LKREIEVAVKKYEELLNRSIDWFIAGWKEVNPKEKKICQLKYEEFSKKADKMNTRIIKLRTEK
jgi:hypothetical protein